MEHMEAKEIEERLYEALKLAKRLAAKYKAEAMYSGTFETDGFTFCFGSEMHTYDQLVDGLDPERLKEEIADSILAAVLDEEVFEKEEKL